MKMFTDNNISWIVIICLLVAVCLGCEPDIIKNSVGYSMVLIEPGTFKMGSNYGKGYEKPVHEVTITRPFYIGKYEVTYKEYERYCKDTGIDVPVRSDWVRDNSPIVYVSWYDAVKYCNWLSENEDLPTCYIIDGDTVTCDFNVDGYRLPTEAEWDWAARGGKKSNGYKYSGSNDPSESGWNLDNPFFIEDNGTKTHIIGKKCPNELGLYDMSGNAWEWCYDWKGNYLPEPQVDPRGPDNGESRILRGGSWEDYITCMRVTNRYSCNPVHNFLPMGFRYIRVIQTN